MILIVLLAAAVIWLVSEYRARLVFTYRESGSRVANPFQGVYFQCSTGDPDRLYDVAEEHPDYDVVLLTFLLDDEREMEVIPNDKMRDLEHTLQIAQELGLSVIFRAAYDFIGEYEDPEFEIMLKHIRQTGQVLNAYKSCIAGVQAGMIGAFGEWTQSRYMDTKIYRMEVIRAWESVLDARIPVSVRRQKFIREAESWGCDTGRLGVYNDGLFSSESDLGTYREDYTREEDLKWSAANIKVPFNGGEMPFISEFTDIHNVAEEARQLNLSYLHAEYNHEVWQYWAEQEYDNMPGDEYIKMHYGEKAVTAGAEGQKQRICYDQSGLPVVFYTAVRGCGKADKGRRSNGIQGKGDSQRRICKSLSARKVGEERNDRGNPNFKRRAEGYS